MALADQYSSNVPAVADRSVMVHDEVDDTTFEEAMAIAAEAVTTLADRLNALALRVALISSIDDSSRSVTNSELYLAKLYSLVDAAAKQMRLIQKLLPVLQASALQKTNGDLLKPD